ncbi:hypothetical protein B0H14DRAFT_2770032 [Mycena olivaceomarginata]|nr:hypothetical protein B0H14DRAFT_2770032 [Mycena olivaceomarginata]
MHLFSVGLNIHEGSFRISLPFPLISKLFTSLSIISLQLIRLLPGVQFPVRLAFCMTINKAQGQSVDHVGLDLRTNVFAQRTAPIQRIKALFKTDVSTVTKNIVYPEVLLV